MTLGEKIRAGGDPALAGFIAAVMAHQRKLIMRQLREQGIEIEIISVPMMTEAAILQIIKSEVKEGPA